MDAIRILLIMGAFLPIAGCQPRPAQFDDFVGTGHRELRGLLSIPSDVILNEDVIAKAWNEKFPVGTPHEEIVGALPPSPASRWPWNVIIEGEHIIITSHADLDLRFFYLSGRFCIALDFEHELLVAMRVGGGALGL